MWYHFRRLPSWKGKLILWYSIPLWSSRNSPVGSLIPNFAEVLWEQVASVLSAQFLKYQWHFCFHLLHFLEAGKDSCQWAGCERDQPGRLLSTARCCPAWPRRPRPPPVEARGQCGHQKCKASCPTPPGLPARPLSGMGSVSWAVLGCLLWVRMSLGGWASAFPSSQP